MKKIVVFGTFDILHPGHISLFEQARKLGDLLVVVVARDKTVQEVKGSAPLNDEKDRLSAIRKISLVDEAVLGNQKDKYKILEKVRPDVICLGYDQKHFTHSLKKELKNRGIRATIVRLRPYGASTHKSSRIKRNRYGVSIPPPRT